MGTDARALARFVAAIGPERAIALGNRTIARMALQRDPFVCDPTVASCAPGTVAPDGTPNAGVDQSPAGPSASAPTATPPPRSPNGRRRPSVCDPSVASCPAGTVAPNGSLNTGTDSSSSTPPARASVCDPAVSSCMAGTVAPDGTPNVGGDVHPAGTFVPRPAGVPLDQAVQLVPLQGVSAHVIAALPDGQIVTVRAVERTLETGGSGSAGAIMAINYRVTNYGFAAAGENSFGIVAIPRIQPLIRGGQINPNANPLIDLARPLDQWGHTAMYVRRGGQIEWVRGFNPDMSPVQLPGFLRNAGDIEAGRSAWPGVVESDTSMLTSTMARTVEYPISPELAAEIARGHPAGAGGTGGSPLNYTARPGTYAASQGDPLLVCTNTNCVGYAVRAGEAHLGGPIGPQGGGSVVDIGRGGAVEPNAAGQGQLYRLLTQAESGEVTLSVPPEATGVPVVGAMPTAFRYVKWGGRVFLVIGIAAGAYEVATAPEGQGARTAVGVAGGFAGGFALGATAGLFCGPGAPVCSIVLGFGLGIAGSLAGRSLAEAVYDAGNNVHAAVYTDEMNRAAHNGVVCPNCHQPLGQTWQLGPGSRSNSILGAVGSHTAGGHSRTMSDQDLRILRQWLDAHPAPVSR
jgi:hypothetical protein